MLRAQSPVLIQRLDEETADDQPGPVVQVALALQLPHAGVDHGITRTACPPCVQGLLIRQPTVVSGAVVLVSGDRAADERGRAGATALGRVTGQLGAGKASHCRRYGMKTAK